MFLGKISFDLKGASGSVMEPGRNIRFPSLPSGQYLSQMDPRPTRYTPIAVTLHWIVALLIIGNLGFGLYVAGLPISPAKLRTVSWHKWVGITILLVAAVRLAWRLRHPVPALPAAMAPWERAQAGLFLAMQYPTEVPGVALVDLLEASFAAAGRDVAEVPVLVAAEAERIGFD